MTRDEFRNAFRALLEDAVNGGLEAKDVRSVIEEDMGAHDAAEIERLRALGLAFLNEQTAENAEKFRCALEQAGAQTQKGGTL